MATKINAEVIHSALENLTLPPEQNNISGFISQIVVKDGNVVFAIKADEKFMNAYHDFRNEAEKLISGIEGVESVKIALTSHITKAKEHNSKKEKALIPGVKKTLVVASGKGGVGKSTIAFNLAVELAKSGLKVGLVDLDIYGPSLGELSGIRNKPVVSDGLVMPHEKFGIKLMSVSFLLGDSKDALAWRGPMVSKMLYQLLNLTKWNNEHELDVLVIDTPPGTGDVHLSLFEKYKIDQVLLVTTPHILAIADVKKSINLLEKLDVDILGVVNNMSYMKVGDNKIYPFGKAFEKEKAFKKYKCFNLPISEIISSSVEYSLPVCEADNDDESFKNITSHIKNLMI